MPRYYFDVTKGGQTFVDDQGDDLADDAAARKHVRRLLVEQAQSFMRREDGGEIIVKVRDGTVPRFVAKLSMSLE
jgi:hypothetical protein